MQVRRHPTMLHRMLATRLKRVAAVKPVLMATLVETHRVCGKASCRCRRGFKHRAFQVTFKERGQSRSVYVPVDFTDEVRSWIDEYRRLKALLREISQLCLALLRSHVQERKRRRGRP